MGLLHYGIVSKMVLNDDMDVPGHCIYKLKENMAYNKNEVASYLSAKDTTKLFGSMIALLVAYHRIYGNS